MPLFILYDLQSCLNNTRPLKDFLATIYSASAQYNDPWSHPVEAVCSGIDGAAQGATILERIFSGIKQWMTNQQCLDVGGSSDYDPTTPETIFGWDWQVQDFANESSLPHCILKSLKTQHDYIFDR